MKRTGSAIWNGSVKEGAGKVSTESGALSDLNYSFKKRFGDVRYWILAAGEAGRHWLKFQRAHLAALLRWQRVRARRGRAPAGAAGRRRRRRRCQGGRRGPGAC